MPQPITSAGTNAAPANNRRSPRRRHFEQHRDDERRMRRVVAWLRSLQSR
jgi:hypothetical protein